MFVFLSPSSQSITISWGMGCESATIKKVLIMNIRIMRGERAPFFTYWSSSFSIWLHNAAPPDLSVIYSLMETKNFHQKGCRRIPTLTTTWIFDFFSSWWWLLSFFRSSFSIQRMFIIIIIIISERSRIMHVMMCTFMGSFKMFNITWDRLIYSLSIVLFSLSLNMNILNIIHSLHIITIRCEMVCSDFSLLFSTKE